MKRKLIILLLTSILLLAFATPAFADGPNGGQVMFGRNLTLEAEEIVHGDVVVFGGNLTMPASSRIEGDLAVFGGNAKIDGTVEGDIVVAGGNANLGETAVIEGDLALLGGMAHIDEGAVVSGEIVRPFGGPEEGFTIPVPPPDVPPVPSVPQSGFSGMAHRTFSFVENIAQTIALIIGLAAVSWVVATFMPAHMKQVSDTVIVAGPVSFGLGLITVLLSVAVGIPLMITICLAFVPVLAWIVIGIAVLFGWIVIGQMIGEKLLTAAGQVYPNFVYSTVIGTVVLTILSKMPIISWIPCLGFIFGLIGTIIGIVVSLTGLGAVILTRFGTQPYTPSPSSGYGGPIPPTGPGGAETDFSDLDVNAASEAELKAKIQAALAEADRLKKEVEAKQKEVFGEETPPDDEAPDQPDDDTPGEESPDDDPDQKPEPKA